MSFPIISIVIPSYNQGHFLEETLVSIISQDYPNLELFVVDGGSADNSVEIIGKYKSHISWWASEKDKGQSDAINKGFRKASGEIITWINSDDLLLQGILFKVADYFSALPADTGLIHGGTILFNGKKNIETRFTYQRPCKEAYVSGMVFSQPAAFFKRKYLITTGLLNEDLHYGMDYDLFMRLSLVCDFAPVNEVFSKYRLHQKSKSVMEGGSFIGDWKKSFVSLCKNLSWNKELAILKETGLFDREIDFHQTFSFKPESRITSALNMEKSTCFHLGHVFKDLYWNNRHEEAKSLMQLMIKKFPVDWFREDQRLMDTMNKLKMPGFVLKTLKRIKRALE